MVCAGLQVYAGVGVKSQFGPVLFGQNDLRPAVFRCKATDSVPLGGDVLGYTRQLYRTIRGSYIGLHETFV